jgi:hypothetical protein
VFQQQSGGGGGRSLAGCQDATVPVSPDTDSVPDRLINSPPVKVKPDPAFHSNADPDPAFYSNADPDPAAKNIFWYRTVPYLNYIISGHLLDSRRRVRWTKYQSPRCRGVVQGPSVMNAGPSYHHSPTVQMHFFIFFLEWMSDKVGELYMCM